MAIRHLMLILLISFPAVAQTNKVACWELGSIRWSFDSLSSAGNNFIRLYDTYKFQQDTCYRQGAFQGQQLLRSRDIKSPYYWKPKNCGPSPINIKDALSAYLLETNRSLSDFGRSSMDQIAEKLESEICLPKEKSFQCDYAFPEPRSLTLSDQRPQAVVKITETSNNFEVVRLQVNSLAKLYDIATSSENCEAKEGRVLAWAKSFTPVDLDELLLYETIRRDPNSALNNPEMIRSFEVLNTRTVIGNLNFKGLYRNFENDRLMSVFGNSLIRIENDVTRALGASTSDGFRNFTQDKKTEALAKMVDQFLEVVHSPALAEKKARSFAIDCDLKASRQLVKGPAICTVSGFGYKTDGTYDYLNNYDSGQDGRFHCYPDRNFSGAEPLEGLFAPKGFTQKYLGYGNSCMMDFSFAKMCADVKADRLRGQGDKSLAEELCAEGRYSATSTIASFCKEDYNHPVCLAAREICQDSRSINYSKLGCFNKPIIFNPMHFLQLDGPMDTTESPVLMGNWGGRGSSEGGSAHAHHQFTLPGNLLIDPVNVFCRGECFEE